MSLKKAIEQAEEASVAGNWAEAVQRWQSLLDEFRDAPPVAYARLSGAYRALRDFRSAEAVIERGRLRLAGIRLAIEDAEIAMGRKDWEEALRRWQRVLDEFGKEAPQGVQRRMRLASERLALKAAGEATPATASVVKVAGDRPAPPAIAPRGFCPACNTEVDGFLRGPNGRPGARCPSCGALERHRLLAVLLWLFAPETDAARWVLEVAPTPAVAGMLRRGAQAGSYVSMDLDPEADGRAVDVIGDLCAAPFGDRVFDLAICFHVFEHIPDDRAAMAELARTLSAAGLAFVQSPWEPSSPTDEDPEAPAEERVRRFGRADHVRVYGSDFEERMRESGLRTFRVALPRVLPRELTESMVLRGTVWIVARADGRYATMSDDDMHKLIQQRSAELPTDPLRPVAPSTHPGAAAMRTRERTREKSRSDDTMPLILHVGTHKTGTTTIQRTLATHRKELREQGLLYPDMATAFGFAQDGHHAFAHALASERRIDRQAVVDCVRSIHRQVGVHDTVLISSEAIYRHTLKRAPTDEYWHARQCYLETLAEALRGFDVRVLLLRRRRDTFAESLFFEAVSTGYSGSFDQLLKVRHRLLDYDSQIKVFQDVFSNVDVFSFEEAVASGLVDFFFKSIGFVPPRDSGRAHERRSADARVALWMARQNLQSDSADSTVHLRRQFARSHVARDLFSDGAATTLWSSERARREFLESFGESLASQPHRAAARLDDRDTRRISDAFDSWRRQKRRASKR